jgi:hypothetical protein
MKAMRDALRRLAELGEPQAADPAAAASAKTMAAGKTNHR